MDHRATRKKMIAGMVLGGLGGWGGVISIGLQTSVYGFTRDLEQEADDRAARPSCATAATTRTHYPRCSTSSATTTRVSIRARRRSGARIRDSCARPDESRGRRRNAARRAQSPGVRAGRGRGRLYFEKPAIGPLPVVVKTQPLVPTIGIAAKASHAALDSGSKNSLFDLWRSAGMIHVALATSCRRISAASRSLVAVKRMNLSKWP